jgi:chaperonin cofactor prefoldin
MTEEQLKLEHQLRERKRELSEAENTADDIVKTIRQHIYPTPGTDFAYLDGINITKYEIQSQHLRDALLKRDQLKRQIAEIERALG